MGNNKTLYAALAFGPMLLFILGIAVVVVSAVQEPSRHDMPALAMFGIMLLVLGGLLTLASMIMYIIHMSKNTALEDGPRIGWIIGMVLGFFVATAFATTILSIVYYFLHIAKDKPQPPMPPTANPWDAKLNS